MGAEQSHTRKKVNQSEHSSDSESYGSEDGFSEMSSRRSVPDFTLAKNVAPPSYTLDNIKGNLSSLGRKLSTAHNSDSYNSPPSSYTRPARRKRVMGHTSPEMHTHDDLVLLKDNKMLADKITDAHIEEFRHAFTMFDKDGDGSISTKELGTVMRSLGQNPTEKRLRAICNEVDVDGNGKLDFKEFILLMTTHFDSINAECELKTAFQVFDTKGKGWIDEAELRRCLTTIGDRLTTEEVNELLHEADGDHDGCINYLEFVKIMTQESLQVQNATPEGSVNEKSWDVTNYRKQTS